MWRVADYNVDPFPSKLCSAFRQPNLVGPRKESSIVPYKTIIGVRQGIWRIEIDEVPRPGGHHGLFKVTCERFGGSQNAACRPEPVRIQNLPLCAPAIRNVEPATTSVDAVDSVKCKLDQVD